MFEALYLHETFTNFEFKQKWRDERETFVNIYGYIYPVSRVLPLQALSG